MLIILIKRIKININLQYIIKYLLDLLSPKRESNHRPKFFRCYIYIQMRLVNCCLNYATFKMNLISHIYLMYLLKLHENILCYKLDSSKEIEISYRLFGLIGRVFANGLGDLGSIPGRVIPKTFKMVLDTSLLNTQQYKKRVKGKVEQIRERSRALPYTSV